MGEPLRLSGKPGTRERRLIGEGAEWVRCRLEVRLRTGSVRIIDAASDDLLFAVDAACDRMNDVLVDLEERASAKRAA